LKVDILKRLDFSKGLGHVSKFEAIIFHKNISVALMDRVVNTNYICNNNLLVTISAVDQRAIND
jgi:hypothetical protein